MASGLLQQANSKEAYARRLTAAASTAGWPFAAHGMQASDLLVVDDETRKLIEGHRPDSGPTLIAPTDLKDEGVDQQDRVFVLLRSGELAFVRDCKKRLPEHQIVSVTYGDAAEVTDLGAFLKDHELYVLMGSEASGKRELAELLVANDMLSAGPVFTAVSEAWSSWCQDFKFVRHAVRVLRGLANQKTSPRLCLVVSLEQLEQLRVSRTFVPAKFMSFANRYAAKCIYFQNRDKLHVASLQYLLSERGAFSLYDADISDESIEAPSAAILRAFILKILTTEIRFERFLANLNWARVVAAEDVSTSPAKVVNMLTIFMETRLKDQVKVPERAQPVTLPKWASNMTDFYLDDMQEMLGIKLNEVGSYELSTLPTE